MSDYSLFCTPEQTKKALNQGLKIWKPCYFEIDLDPDGYYCIGYSVKFQACCTPVYEKFLSKYGSPKFKSFEKCIEALDNALRSETEHASCSLEEWNKRLDATETNIKILKKNPNSFTPGSSEYYELHGLRNVANNERFYIACWKTIVSFLPGLQQEFNDLKTEFYNKQ